MPSPDRPPLTATEKGFTLIEVMVVVVIVGVLATLAVYGVRNYLSSAKTSEAVSMMASIKAAEEAYKAETFVYLDVSGNFNTSSYHPTATLAQGVKYNWQVTTTTSPNWQTLGVQPDGPVAFTYAVVATAPNASAPGLPTTKTLSQFNLPGTPNRWQYIAVAKGDVGGAVGKFTYVLSHSYSAEIYVENEGD
jgi:type IV pilus assembly protein PilA